MRMGCLALTIPPSHWRAASYWVQCSTRRRVTKAMEEAAAMYRFGAGSDKPVLTGSTRIGEAMLAYWEGGITGDWDSLVGLHTFR
jgi:hypothetical protein